MMNTLSGNVFDHAYYATVGKQLDKGWEGLIDLTEDIKNSSDVPSDFEFTNKVFTDLEKQIFEGIHFDFGWKSAYHSGKTEADEDRGIEMVKVNEFGRKTNEWKQWVGGTNSNIRVAIEFLV